MNIDYSIVLQMMLGLLFIWTGVYLISRNPFLKLSWVIFGLLFSLGFSVLTNPILLLTNSLSEYIVWQKITDWPLFLAPIFFFHASVIIKKSKTLFDRNLLVIGYIGGILFYLLDFSQGIILDESKVRFMDFRRFDSFGPGPLLAPSIIFEITYLIFATRNFFKDFNDGFRKYMLPILGSLILVIVGVITLISFYVKIFYADFIFNIGFIMSTGLVVFSMFKYQLFTPLQGIFNKTFLFKTVTVFIIIILYISLLLVAGVAINFSVFILINLLLMLILFSHSFYDWLSTFINDLVYNAASGFSIVNDEEIGHAVRNYNKPEKLEDSSLLRLKLLKNDKDKVDSLRSTIKNSIEYFKPEEDGNSRNKKNLKYKLLKMLINEAEEGQILWELGFEEYPVKILTQENKTRKPLFQITAPSDYSYTSRNAFIALKKEAIHDVAWRISYLEKLSKK